MLQGFTGNHSETMQPAGRLDVNQKMSFSPPSSPSSKSSCLADCRLFGNTITVRNPKSIQDAEKAITEELYEMSMKEREGALHDIHGVADVNQEPKDFVEQSLNALEVELQRPRMLSSSSTEAFRIAMEQSPTYVRGMYILFLRCEEFRIRDAAERMIRHFALKKDLFGVEKLGRDITLNDFDLFDMECLRAGFFQLLPQRDRAGRCILMKTWYHQTYHRRENVWRVVWYMNQTALLDEETQKKGLVAVIYNVDPAWTETFDAELFAGVGKLVKASALRCVAIHYCFLDAAFGAIIKFISMAMDRNSRTRTRLHHGNHIEVQYELMSFGIPMSAIPVNSDGVMRVKEHSKWIQTRRKHEVLMMKTNRDIRSLGVVLIPSHSDVLFGRGKVFQMHIGNMKLSSILEERGTDYFQAKRNGKNLICASVVSEMKKDGTRFLRQDNDGLWMEADDKTAIDKVGHGFRNRKQSKPSSSSSSQRPTEKRNVEQQPEKTKEQSSSSSLSPSSPPTGVKGFIAAKRLRFEHGKQ